jgi:uncharacterized protein YfaP (DUF2135 family)
METRLSKDILNKVKKLHKNNEQNNKLCREIQAYLNKRYDDIAPEYPDDIHSSNIVQGEVIEKNGTTFLKVEGYALAQRNGDDGCFCRQVCYGEDSFSGELYYKIDDTTFLQVFYHG